ncbi:hypothetical protein M569_08890, partial [Genlisea aurea]
MAEETKTTAAAASEAEVAVPASENLETVVSEKEAQNLPEPKKVEALAVEEQAVEGGRKEEKEGKIAECVSFKEESNKIEDLVDPEKKALDELKLLIQEALDKREFSPPQPPAPVAERETKAVEKKEGEESNAESTDLPEEIPLPPQPASEAAKEENVDEKPSGEDEAPPEEKSETAEDIKETIVHEVAPPPPPAPEKPSEEETPEQQQQQLLPPEEISIWGKPLLSDVILLKFLRARDFKAKEAFAMLKSVISWRKHFRIDDLLQEEEATIDGLDKVVYIHGVDREGHPVSYNALGEFQDKDLYSKAFADAEKREKFLRWYIQFLEKNIRKLDLTPDGISTIVQIIDLNNSPGFILFKKELRQSTNQALQLLQDNYPEFVAKQVFVNVPWWYVAYNRLISPFLTQRTKSKFVFAGPTRTTETLFKYIAPEQLPVQYGGLSKEGDAEFSSADSAVEEIIKPASKHAIEIPVSEPGTVVWEVRVIGSDVIYGAEFVPDAEGSYTWIVQKARKMSPSEEQQLIFYSFKIGETGKVVVTFENQNSKKKKLVYRFKIKN